MVSSKKTAAEKRVDLRQALQSGKLLRFPGAFSPFVSIIIEELGFDGLYISGATLASDRGLPDIGLTALPEVSQGSVIDHFDRLSFNDGTDPHYLMLAITSPRESILAGMTKVRNWSVLITVVFALWGIALALFFSRYLTRSLRQVTRALAGFGRDDEPPIVDLHGVWSEYGETYVVGGNFIAPAGATRVGNVGYFGNNAPPTNL